MGKTSEEAAVALCNLAYRLGSSDNITAVVVTFFTIDWFHHLVEIRLSEYFSDPFLGNLPRLNCNHFCYIFLIALGGMVSAYYDDIIIY